MHAALALSYSPRQRCASERAVGIGTSIERWREACGAEGPRRTNEVFQALARRTWTRGNVADRRVRLIGRVLPAPHRARASRERHSGARRAHDGVDRVADSARSRGAGHVERHEQHPSRELAGVPSASRRHPREQSRLESDRHLRRVADAASLSRAACTRRACSFGADHPSGRHRDGSCRTARARRPRHRMDLLACQGRRRRALRARRSGSNGRVQGDPNRYGAVALARRARRSAR